MILHETELVAFMVIGYLIHNKECMAKIIKSNGEQIEVAPMNGNDFKLEELQTIVGGWVEIVWLPNNEDIMVINEEGKLYNLPLNKEATKIYQDSFGYTDLIVGDVLLCKKNQIE